MRFCRGSLLLLAVLAIPEWAMGQDTRLGIAVLAFENGGSYGQDKEDFTALERGIPGMLISELSRHPDARLVDRGETQRLLDEQDLAAGGRIDAATAARIGKMLGARYMVFGTFIDVYGEFRVDARIVDVESSEILHVATANNNREQLYHIIQDIADQILADVELPPLPAAVGQARVPRDVPTDALTYYSRALLYQDRGDKAQATEFYRRALEVFPDYTEAQEGLRHVESS
ncbi:MAG: CsgG/HfaB family protein [Gemmatimonadales bacterium]